MPHCRRAALALSALLTVSCAVSVPPVDDGTFACASDDDCAEGFACDFSTPSPQGHGVCRPHGDSGCDADNDCGGGRCLDGACVSCIMDSDCGGGRCADGVCLGGCNQNADCGGATPFCDLGRHACVDPCAEHGCGASEYCKPALERPSGYFCEGAVCDPASCAMSGLGYHCSNGSCTNTCSTNAECMDASLSCVAGVCQPAGCSAGAACPAGYSCQGNVCLADCSLGVQPTWCSSLEACLRLDPTNQPAPVCMPTCSTTGGCGLDAACLGVTDAWNNATQVCKSCGSCAGDTACSVINADGFFDSSSVDCRCSDALCQERYGMGYGCDSMGLCKPLGCTSSATCATGLCLWTGELSGFGDCRLRCETMADCSSGERCVPGRDLGGNPTGVCAPTPSCNGCPASGLACIYVDETLKETMCVGQASPGGPVDACTSDSECPANAPRCVESGRTPLVEPYGVCRKLCGNCEAGTEDCDATAQRFGAADGMTVSVCRPGGEVVNGYTTCGYGSPCFAPDRVCALLGDAAGAGACMPRHAPVDMGRTCMPGEQPFEAVTIDTGTDPALTGSPYAYGRSEKVCMLGYFGRSYNPGAPLLQNADTMLGDGASNLYWDSGGSLSAPLEPSRIETAHGYFLLGTDDAFTVFDAYGNMACGHTPGVGHLGVNEWGAAQILVQCMPGQASGPCASYTAEINPFLLTFEATAASCAVSTARLLSMPGTALVHGAFTDGHLAVFMEGPAGFRGIRLARLRTYGEPEWLPGSVSVATSEAVTDLRISRSIVAWVTADGMGNRTVSTAPISAFFMPNPPFDAISEGSMPVVGLSVDDHWVAWTRPVGMNNMAVMVMAAPLLMGHGLSGPVQLWSSPVETGATTSPVTLSGHHAAWAWRDQSGASHVTVAELFSSRPPRDWSSAMPRHFAALQVSPTEAALHVWTGGSPTSTFSKSCYNFCP